MPDSCCKASLFAAPVEGAQTMLGTDAYSMADDPALVETIVPAEDSATIRIGNLILLEPVTSLAHDSASQTIYAAGTVTTDSPHGAALARTADGKVAPARNIAGNLSMIMQRYGLAVVPSSLTLEKGFE